ncbi:MAG: ATP-binding protein [Candidatus Dormibacteria bacterium]
MQDAAVAMHGDVVRALVELVTNCDDAYDEAGHSGRIRIEVDRTRREGFVRIAVSDAATGMSPTSFQTKLLTAGERQSGHEQGKQRRGLLGRGAKDTTYFGKTVFESIKDGEYACATLTPNHYDEFDSRPATPADYARLRLRRDESGVTATMYVGIPPFRLSRQETLAKRLRQHVQLRRIMSDPGRVVTLGRWGETSGELLQYGFPVKRAPIGNPMPLTISGYPDAKAILTLWKLESPLPDVRDASRDAGILVVGRRAVYESTYFGCENRAGARHYVGQLECPTLDALQQSYDDGEQAGSLSPAENPGPIVLRTRDGLDRAHPFVKALAAAVDAKLTPLVDEAERLESQRRLPESAEMAKRMRTLSRQLSALYDTIAQGLDTEVDPRDPTEPGPPKPVTFEVLPDMDTVDLQPGGSQTFSVRAWPAAWSEASPAPEPMLTSASIDGPEIATVEPDQRILTADPSCPGRFRGTFTVRAGAREDVTVLTLRLGNASREVLVSIARVAPEQAPAPDRLQWDQRSYTAKVGRPKLLVLMAPAALVEGVDGGAARLSLSTPLFELPGKFNWVTGQGGDGRSWYEASLEVVGESDGAAQLRARCGGQVAVCQVTVTEHGGQGLIEFKAAEGHPRLTQRRADWDPAAPAGVKRMLYFVDHPTLAPAFSKEHGGPDGALARMEVAEAVASRLAQDLLYQQWLRHPETSARDPGEYSQRFDDVFGRLLSAAQGVQVPELFGILDKRR